jgi:hypothetical protein
MDHSHDDTHGHSHGHSHHDHSHDADTYFVDQLCMVGMAGAFAAICLSLYFWNPNMLDLTLAPPLQIFVLISGVTLAVLTLLRALSLWLQPAPGHHHHHGHDHHHEHSHEPHTHLHAHGHHHHDHSEEDHDHGWAPWRYVVLLVPVILFLLGLPNKGPALTAVDLSGLRSDGAAIDTTGSTTIATSDFLAIVKFALGAETREQYKDKWVKVRGQFMGNDRDEKIFTLGRFRINCCGADAIQLNVPIISPVPITNWRTGDWVEVHGKIDFAEVGGKMATILRIPNADAIRACQPEKYLW